MDRFEWLEASFEKWIEEAEGKGLDILYQVDMPLLERMGVVKEGSIVQDYPTGERKFSVIQGLDKMTLYNEQFVVWIVPQNVDDKAASLVWIAQFSKLSEGILMGFLAKGPLNNSKIVLRLLEAFLEEIEETDKLISNLEKGVS